MTFKDRRTKIARVKVNTLQEIRLSFPDSKTDADKFDMLMARSKKLKVMENVIDKSGEFIWGKRTWKKILD